MSMIDNILYLKKKKKKQNHAEFWHKEKSTSRALADVVLF